MYLKVYEVKKLKCSYEYIIMILKSVETSRKLEFSSNCKYFFQIHREERGDIGNAQPFWTGGLLSNHTAHGHLAGLHQGNHRFLRQRNIREHTARYCFCLF